MNVGRIVARARWAAVTTLLLLLCGLGFAQETADQVFAPFVSRIRMSLNDPMVRVSWKDSEDIDGTYQVYRHTEPINTATLADAELVGTVPQGTQSYIDTPELPGSYHYAVLAITETGSPYPVIISGRNTSISPTIVGNIETVVDRVANATGIEATLQSISGQPGISVSYATDRNGRTMIVYRSTQPFLKLADLERGSVVVQAPSEENRVTDYPVPGVSYYYAVVDSEAVLEGTITFLTGSNTTGEALEIPLPTTAGSTPPPALPPQPEPVPAPEDEQVEVVRQDETTIGTGIDPAATQVAPTPQRTEGGLAPISAVTAPELASSIARPVPLPFLQLQTEVSTGVQLAGDAVQVPAPQQLSVATIESVEQLLGSLDPLERITPEPVVLPDDTLVDPQGAEFTLRTVLTGPFEKMAWEEVVTQIGYFFMLPLTEDLKARAHFYRAQAYFFMDRPELAFVELLQARDRYYAEVSPWLNRILDDSPET